MKQLSVKICFLEEAKNEETAVEAEKGETIAQAAFRAGVVIQQTCGGSPSCTDCRVKVLEGGADAFQAMEHEEETLLGNVFFITKERLACQAKIQGPSKLWIPDPKQFLKKNRSPKGKS